MKAKRFRQVAGIAFMMIWCSRMTVKAGEIRGVVTDAESNDPIAGVTVQVKGTANQTTSNTSGQFTLVGGTAVTGFLGNIPQPFKLFDYDPGSRTISWEHGGATMRLYTTDGSPILVANKGNRSVLPQPADGMYVLDFAADGRHMVSKVMAAGPAVNVTAPVYAQAGPRAKSAAGDITIEAEHMTLDGKYIIDTTRMNGAGIMIDPNLPVPSTGVATTTFDGPSGTYKIIIRVAPENDGQPVIKLYAGANVLYSGQFPSEPGFTDPAANRYDITVSNAVVNQGDQIKIEGTSAGTAAAGAFARVDQLVFSDPNNVTLVFSKSGYRQQELAASFGGADLAVKMEALQQGGWPDASNTGPAGSLTSSGPITVTTNGAVIQNLNVSGAITINADNVTIRNCQFGSLNVPVGNTYTGTVVEDCILGWAGHNYFTLRRCEMSSQSDDLIRISGPEVTIEDCYLHVDGPEVAGTHCDIMQEYPVGTGANCTVRHNTLYIAIKQNSCIFDLTDVLVENNLLAGAGYTMYVNSGYRVINNHFSTKFFPNCGYWGPMTGTPGTCTGNVWHETGLPLNCK